MTARGWFAVEFSNGPVIVTSHDLTQYRTRFGPLTNHVRPATVDEARRQEQADRDAGRKARR